jgi:hypothetical protein
MGRERDRRLAIGLAGDILVLDAPKTSCLGTQPSPKDQRQTRRHAWRHSGL